MIVLEFIVTFFCAYLGSVIGRTISIHTGNYPPDTWFAVPIEVTRKLQEVDNEL